MALLAAQNVKRTGTVASYAACSAGGDSLPRGDNFIHVKNTDGSPHTLTIVSQATPGPGEAVANEAVVCAAGTERFIGTFPPPFGDADNRVQLTYDGVTGMSIAVIDSP